MVDKIFTSHKLAKSANEKIVSSIVLDSKFWEDCVITVKIIGLLIKLFRMLMLMRNSLCDMCMKACKRTKNAIKTMFRNKKMRILLTNILRSLLDFLEVKTLYDDLAAAMQEIQLYRNRKKSFGKESALRMTKRLEPGKWWMLYSGSAPNL
ncbi:hypothetical protein Ahy_B05g076591 isoform B [Arachis hypogaea]|uniref:HAT C-terminal dimerisation domain-containing protein n=1 Tax=Arachis hypogaea TaxID=3818 RepID=A0A444Z3K7_ARAHY|nr:hypothetical protein Ahy_B05g076591 isoform B [Arachis hypogaea]